MKLVFLRFVLLYDIVDIVCGAAPTKPPTKWPTSAPTSPTTNPTVQPTVLSTASPSVNGEKQLFAVVGGLSCADYLFFGPQAITESGSADGLHPYFLSTNTLSASVPHTNWLQIVTSDGSNELFRIYWSFRTAKTISQRFTDAVISGESVDYRIEVPGQTLFKTATWWFSSAADIPTAKFTIDHTTCCFSANDGAWGAAEGTVDGNGDGYVHNQFWGVGNWDSIDNVVCDYIYQDGVADITLTGTKTFMYYFAPIPPSVEPTAAPTIMPSTLEPSVVPTAVPTQEPSRTPSQFLTLSPTTSPTAKSSPFMGSELFAVVGGDSCAENLYYGTKYFSAAGSADGLHPYYLSTLALSTLVPHKYWLQVVTSDGVNELFRVYWTFTAERTLTDHLYYAAANGVYVDYVVVTPSGQQYTYSASWRFSSAAQIASTAFPPYDSHYPDALLSADSGAWGAGASIVDGYAGIPTNFWGIGNFRGSDADQCSTVYQNGVGSAAYGTGVKVFMYASALPLTSAAPTRGPTKQPVEQRTASPTALPTQPLPMITFVATQQVDGVSFDAYTANSLAFIAVFKATIASSVTSISTADITYFAVSPVSRRRRLLSTGDVESVRPRLVAMNSHESVQSEREEGDRAQPSTTTTGTTTNVNLRAEVIKYTSSDGVRLDYTISVPEGSGRTYNDMSTQLTNSVNNNQFTTLLQLYAATQNVPELTSASSSSIETQKVSKSDDSSGSVLTVPAIVGVAIGGTAALLLLVFLCYWFCYAPDGSLPQFDTARNQASAPPQVSDPSLSKDINAYFYGDSAHSERSDAGTGSGRNNQIVVTDHADDHAAFETESGGAYATGAPRFSQRADLTGAASSAERDIDLSDPSISKSVSAPPSVNQPHPVAAVAMAVSIDHTHIAHSPDHEIAVAEVYIGVEEHKE